MTSEKSSPTTPPNDILAVARSLVAVLRGHRYRFITEADLSASISELLESITPNTFRNEVRLSPQCRIDFFAYGIGIELKTYRSGGSLKDTVTQLQRYAECPEIQALILVSGNAKLVSELPDTLCGKPIYGVTARGPIVS